MSQLNMLCDLCQDFDYDQMKSESGQVHHKSLSSLVDSAEEQCPICTVLMANFKPWDDVSISDLKAQSRLDGAKECPVICKLEKDLDTLSWKSWGSLGKIDVEFVPCTTVDDPLSTLLNGRVVDKDILSDGCLQMARDWLKICTEEHPNCPVQEDLPLPTRVIDVGSATSEPRLIVTAGCLGIWAALSHCWGSHQPLKTEIMTLEDHCKSLPLSSLPATFREAIVLTRSLGIQYLWIDSLCILQDSRDDWLSESAMMGTIFKNALVTIAADASADSSIGLVGSSASARQSREPLMRIRCHSSSQNANGFLYLREQKFEYYGFRGPLSRRGWALQEEILSPRILQFTSDLVFWRCVETRANELFPDIKIITAARNEFKPHLKSNVARSYLEVFDSSSRKENCFFPYIFKGDLLSFWYGHIVDEYILRALTYQSDKFIALAGIAREVQSHVEGSEYKAGLWTNDIHRGLLWSQSERGYLGGAIRYKDYVAPSWSWASFDFANITGDENERCIYRHLLCEDLRPEADVLEICVQNVNNDPFGMVESASITIRGGCYKACYCRVPISFFDERAAPIEDETANLDDCVIPSSQADLSDRLEFASKGMSFHGTTITDKMGQTILGFGHIPIKEIEEQECVETVGASHNSLLYLKVASFAAFSTSSEFDIVVCLILETALDESTTKYRRVGRALVSVSRSQSIIWPIETITIV